MNQKVYFAGSIRGGQSDTALYHEVIEHIKQKDTDGGRNTDIV